MKITHFFVALLCLFLTSVGYAKVPGPTKFIPKIDLGVKVGASYDNMNGTGWSNTYRTGYHGGLFLGFREQVFGVQGELLLNTPHYTSAAGTQVKNLCLDIPAMFEIRLIPRLWIQVGPQYSFLVSSKYESNSTSTNFFKPGAFSGVAGLQALLPLHLTIGARYIFGLSDWDNTGGAAWKQRSTQLFVGFKFI